MNPIKNIEIKNFKSIRHLKIDDCKRINVFIGYPNVGKSNILEALSLFSIDEPNLSFSSFVRLENLTTLFHNGEVNEQAEIRINEKSRFILKYKKDQVLLQRQFERKGTSFEKADRGRGFDDFSDKIDIRATFQLRENQDKLLDFNIPSIGKEHFDVRKYEYSKHIKFANDGYSTLSYPYGQNIFNLILTNEILRREVSELFKVNELNFSYDKTTQDFKILKFAGDEIFIIPYSLIAEDVIFDKSNQFFMATHSPYVLNSFMEEVPEDLSIYLVYYEKGETKVKLMSEKDMDEVREYGVDLFYNLESYLKHGQVNNA